MAPTLLRQGDSGPGVADIRERLRRLGFCEESGRHIAADTYDEGLADAVRAFQQHRGIPVDGVVGPQTFRHLDEARWTLGDRVLLFNPGHLMSGDDVLGLQQRLVNLGFDCGRPDGVFGVATDSAIREFQRNVGVDADGMCGPDTYRALQRLTRTVGEGELAAPLRERLTWDSARSGVAGKVVMLDPGGADADEQFAETEAAIIADVCARLEGRLAAVGTQVLLTRTPAPTLVEENRRAAFANEMGADLLVSLHVERVQLPNANGISTFYFGDPRGGTHSFSGRHAAELMHDEVCRRTDLTDCRAHPRTWDLLRLTRMPAVWMELGYLSHPRDAARLADPRFRDAVADGLAAAVVAYFAPDPASADEVLGIEPDA
jgi:N-acetylmuramoyl-L-alanine amidase